MRVRVIAVLAVPVILLSACGGEDDPSAADGAPGSSPSPTALAASGAPTPTPAPTAADTPTPAAAPSPTASAATTPTPSAAATTADQAPQEDLLTFARGAVPVALAVEGPGEDLTTAVAVQAIDGNPITRTYLSRATADSTAVMTFLLPAPTTFTQFAIPGILETPSPSATFFRAVEILGADSPDGPFTSLVRSELAAHQSAEEVMTLAPASATAIRVVQVRLSGGLDLTQPESFLEFSELIGIGSQDPVPPETGFTGVWDTLLADIDRSAGLMELTQQGVVVTGCYGSVDLDGTVDGALARLQGVDRDDGTRSAYILDLAEDGSLQLFSSTNGAPFAFMRSTVAPAGATTPCSAAPPPEPTLGCGDIVHGIGFDVDSAVLRPDAEPVLQALFEGLAADPASEITIEGHTSTEGSEAYNLDLSGRRAQAVVDELVRRGIAAGRLRALGVGEAEPLISPDEDETARSTNRRVEVTCG